MVNIILQLVYQFILCNINSKRENDVKISKIQLLVIKVKTILRNSFLNLSSPTFLPSLFLSEVKDYIVQTLLM